MIQVQNATVLGEITAIGGHVADLDSTLGEAVNEGAEVHATCPNDHTYKLDLRKLADLATPYARLDEVILSKSWCPYCSELASNVSIQRIETRGSW